MKNMKLSLLLSGLMGLSLIVAQETPLVDAAPDKVEVAWDLDGVLVHRNWAGKAKEAWNFPGLFSELVKHPLALYAVVATAFKGGATGEPYALALKPYSNVLAAAAFKLASTGSIDPNVAAIIKELNALGYTQRIASNIGTEEVKLLGAENSDLFTIFEGGKTVTYYEDGSRSVKKPARSYFEEYNATYNADSAKAIIFIDDQLKNINGAHQVEPFVPVKFDNAQQLRADLKALGIPLR